jgi:hypothetical protein
MTDRRTHGETDGQTTDPQTRLTERKTDTQIDRCYKVRETASTRPPARGSATGTQAAGSACLVCPPGRCNSRGGVRRVRQHVGRALRSQVSEGAHPDRRLLRVPLWLAVSQPVSQAASQSVSQSASQPSQASQEASQSLSSVGQAANPALRSESAGVNARGRVGESRSQRSERAGSFRCAG